MYYNIIYLYIYFIFFFNFLIFYQRNNFHEIMFSFQIKLSTLYVINMFFQLGLEESFIIDADLMKTNYK